MTVNTQNEIPTKEWTREIPEPPKKAPSFYWWFWDDKDWNNKGDKSEATVLELWPNRNVSHKKGWWAVCKVNRPASNPFTDPPAPPPDVKAKSDGLLKK